MEPKALGANCDSCPLQDRPVVFGDGPVKAKICIVGEAPGENEVKEGKPFVGKSGQLLNSILAQHNIRREDVYTTNAVLCHPKENKTPGVKAIKACRGRLVEELRSRSPEVILTLGSVPTKSILATSEGITKLRTRTGLTNEDLGVRVIPTFHPAYALRSPDVYPSIISDVGKIQNPTVSVGWEPTIWKLTDDIHEAIRYLERQSSFPILSLDVETYHERGWPNNPHRPGFLCMAIAHGPGKAMVYGQQVSNDPRFLGALERAFQGDTKWIMQYGKFDIQRLWTNGVPSAHLDHDPAIAHYSVDERVGTHDLEQMAVELLAAPAYKTDTRQWLPYDGAPLSLLPPAVLHEYNAADADVTFRLIDKLQPMMVADGVDKLYRDLLIPAQNALARVEYRGIPIDVERLNQLEDELSVIVDERKCEITARWGFNPNSVPQVKEFIEQELDIEMTSTDKEHLRDLIAKLGVHDIAQCSTAILKYRSVHKLHSTYARGLQKRLQGDRIYSSFNQQTTVTGRLSSSNPNMQNQPRPGTHPDLPNFRDVVMAPDGYTILSSDYSAIEMRLIALEGRDDYLLQAFREGRNLHMERAHRIWGPGVTKKDKLYVWGKNIAFGSLYEGSAAYLAWLYDIPVHVAQAVQSDLHRHSPGIKRYWGQVHKEVLDKHYLRSRTGRVRRYWLITPENWKDIKKEAVNFKIQSWASDLTLSALVKLEPILRNDAPPIITIHDDLTFECKEEAVADVANTVKRVMEDTGLEVSTPIEIEVGKRWGSKEEYVIA